MNVLLIEDSALIRNVINESLEECTDISISTYAETQHHAIELLKLEQFDMLLVDIELSQGNGFEVIKFAQSAEYLFSPPVIIILTNNASSYYRLMAKQLGVNFFFDKSMDFDLAIETITNVAFKFTHPH
ncbi:MAG: response regulator transcription factor [Methylophilaceae bacterium]|nr:response regulator transcription factor [Methylophilaceae bacterium]